MIRRIRVLSITTELLLLESPSPASLWERGDMDVWNLYHGQAFKTFSLGSMKIEGKVT